MTNQHALAFARSPAAILFQGENDNMWGDWEDYIVATRTKRGVYAVLARKLCDEYLDGTTKKKWFIIHKVRDIKKPEEFVKAVKQCEAALNVDVSWSAVVEGISRLDIEFSIQVENLVTEIRLG